MWESDNIRTSTLALPSMALDIWPGYFGIYLMVDETIQGLMSCWRVSDSHHTNQALKNHCTEKKQKHIHKSTVGSNNPHRADRLIIYRPKLNFGGK